MWGARAKRRTRKKAPHPTLTIAIPANLSFGEVLAGVQGVQGVVEDIVGDIVEDIVEDMEGGIMPTGLKTNCQPPPPPLINSCISKVIFYLIIF